MGNASSVSEPGVVAAPLGVDLNHFEYIEDSDFGMMVIGKGGFGLVSVMRYVGGEGKRSKPQKNQRQDLFAVKVMDKQKIVKQNMVDNTMNELSILSSLSRHHANIVNCHYAFQDVHSLYIVLDVCLGGSLAHCLKTNNNQFPLSRAKHYVAELISGIRFLHSENIIHRDIKPDNILVDEGGRIRITDFNVSFKLPKGKLGKTMNHPDGWGTRGYRAPEVYLRQGAGLLFACDWWSLGATLYEMLTGHIPFSIPNNDKDEEEEEDAAGTPLTQMLRDVRERNFDQERLGPEEDLKDFCRMLLEYDPALRLNDVSVSEHAFFRNLDFSQLELIQPPWVPGNPSSQGLAQFASNFDVSMDKRERLLTMHANLHAAGFHLSDEPGVQESDLTVSQQNLFAKWSFNSKAPPPTTSSSNDSVENVPRYGLLQAVSALQSPNDVRQFISTATDQTIMKLLHEMKDVHESLLVENGKFIQAEMRCDELSQKIEI